jgi:hypothetical protein
MIIVLTGHSYWRSWFGRSCVWKSFLSHHGFWQGMVMAGRGLERSWLWQVMFMTGHRYGRSWLRRVMTVAGYGYGRSWLWQVMVIAGHDICIKWLWFFALQSTISLGPKPVYTSTRITENNCRFYNQYEAKSTIYKRSGLPPFLIVFSWSLTPTFYAKINNLE